MSTEEYNASLLKPDCFKFSEDSSISELWLEFFQNTLTVDAKKRMDFTSLTSSQIYVVS